MIIQAPNYTSKQNPSFTKCEYHIIDLIITTKMDNIYLIENTSKTKFVLKQSAIENIKNNKYLINEKKILLHLGKYNHPYIIKLIDCLTNNQSILDTRPGFMGFQQNLDNSLVFEYHESGDLYSFELQQPNHRIDEEYARKYALQIAKAIDYCHHLGVFHGDIKPDNILLTNDNSIKLIDFGLSKFFTSLDDQFTIKQIGGTPGYRAPEILENDYITPRADIWSYGITIFELITGYIPFNTKSQIPSEFTVLEYNIPISHEFEELMLLLLNVTPSKRPSFPEILQHRWFYMKQLNHSNYQATSKYVNPNHFSL